MLRESLILAIIMLAIRLMDTSKCQNSTRRSVVFTLSFVIKLLARYVYQFGGHMMSNTESVAVKLPVTVVTM
ncbi:unnamed protein product [Linum trigynum]|uniref:Secreted protein n=1 Tax=Linum trigynum TaxID=586398 RepID=A0AAV2DHT7_9ROSI